MTRASDQFIVDGVLREHRFESHTPVLGPIIARLRIAWYNVAARWGDQAIIHQQSAYNGSVAQHVAELDRHATEHDQHITEHDQHITEHDQRLILADRDLTDLAHTVAELTQQVVELRHIVEELQVTRS